MIYYIQELSIRFYNLKGGGGAGGTWVLFNKLIWPTSLGTHHLLVVKKKIYKHDITPVFPQFKSSFVRLY